MKRFLTSLSAVVLLMLPFAGSAKQRQDNVSVIEGRWERGNRREMNLYRAENGDMTKIASSALTPDKRFYFAFAPEQEGFYVVGPDEKNAMDNYTFYFKPGDRLRFEVTGDSYRLVGENTPENREMERWHNHMLPLESKSIYFSGSMSTYVDFFPALEGKLKEGYTLKYKGNQTFSKAFESYREFDIAYNAVNFLVTPRSAHPQQSDFPQYYRDLDLRELTATGDLLNYPYGIALIRNFTMTMPRFSQKLTEKEVLAMRDPVLSLDVILPMIGNEILKGEVVLQRTGSVRTYEGFKDFESKCGRYLVTDAQKARFQALLKNIPIPETGPAIDFRFPDTEGREVALSDFKGKVVYIDVWATWCGPCRQQIPALKELEKEYHGKNVVFMSVSTDKTADRQKWLDMVASEGLEGVQLHAGDKARAEILDPYKISGIPRFILVGKDGSIISANAPRPSTSDIRPLLDKALAE